MSEHRMAAPGSGKEAVSRAEESTKFQLNKKRKGKSVTELRHPRQKFCARWELEFPWLKADCVDQSLGYCTICNKQLVCKKSHLERHQDSYRHIRMQMQLGENNVENNEEVPSGMKIDVIVDDGINLETEYAECAKQETEEEDEYVEFDANFEGEIDIDQNYDVEFETIIPAQENDYQQQSRMDVDSKQSVSPVKAEVIQSPKTLVKDTPLGKIDRLKLLKQIDYDRHQLSQFLYERRKETSPDSSYSSPPKLHFQPQMRVQLQRDPFDLFFESVSATVKTLPPKLAAEVKSRVSQIIAEFELRAICEREAQQNAAAAGSIAHTVVMTTSTRSNESKATSAVEDSTLPSIVYSYQPKINE